MAILGGLGIAAVAAIVLKCSSDSDIDDNRDVIESNDSYDHVIDMTKQRCVRTIPPLNEEEHEICETIEPGFENFFKSVTICYDKNTTVGEVQFVRDGIIFSAKFLSDINTNYWQIELPYEEVELYYRPNYNVNVGLGGMAYWTQVSISPLYQQKDGYIHYTNTDNIENYHPYSLMAHELAHEIFKPVLAEVRKMIIEEGLMTYLQYIIAGESPFAEFKNDLFPDQPTKSLVEIKDIKKGESHKVILNGEGKTVTIDRVTEKSIVVDIDSERYQLITGKCDDNGEYMVCSMYNFDGIDLAIFDKENTIRKTIPTETFISEDEAISPTSIRYSDTTIIWGELENGERMIFKSGSMLSKDLSFPRFYTDPDTYMLISAEQYTAAYFLITTLENLYWETYPDRNPNNVFLAFAEIHKDFMNRIYTEEYNSKEHNIYKHLCNKLELDEEACFSVFEKYGLDPENLTFDRRMRFSCKPGMKAFFDSEMDH